MGTSEHRPGTPTRSMDDNSPPALAHLLSPRRSPAADGQEPTDEQLGLMLRSAATVPDHGALQPWRFVVVSGEARHRLGDALAGDCVRARPDSPAAVVEKARRKAFAAPSLIVLVASCRPESNVPEWEQLASAACCGYAIVLAGQALGLGAVWKSTPNRDGPLLRDLCAIGEHEQILGWINVGGHDHSDLPAARPPADISAKTTVLSAGER
jgi:nitroreductase